MTPDLRIRFPLELLSAKSPALNGKAWSSATTAAASRRKGW